MEDIFDCARQGNLSEIHKYIESGIDINIQDKHGQTPLMIASEYSQLECVRSILNLGADPNIVPKAGFYSALQKALSFTRNIDIIVSLLTHGANIHLKVSKYNHDGSILFDLIKEIQYNQNCEYYYRSVLKLFNKSCITILLHDNINTLQGFLNNDLVRHIWGFL